MPIIETERYEINVKPIGRGGFGEVYLARDLLFDRDVVIKTIVASSLYGIDNAKIRRRFFREAALSAKLGFKSPYIVKVYDYGYDSKGGFPFFVLEYLPSGDLRNHVNNFTWSQAAKLLNDMLTGLSVAHSNGVIHSDISPDNILVENNSTYKLNDFGLAKLLTSALMARSPMASLTGGKPAFLPVDHWHSGERTEYSDLYSLAVTIYFLLCGKMPKISFQNGTFSLGSYLNDLIENDKTNGISATQDLIRLNIEHEKESCLGVRFDPKHDHYHWLSYGAEVAVLLAISIEDIVWFIDSILSRKFTETKEVVNALKKRIHDSHAPREKQFRTEIGERKRSSKKSSDIDDAN